MKYFQILLILVDLVDFLDVAVQLDVGAGKLVVVTVVIVAVVAAGAVATVVAAAAVAVNVEIVAAAAAAELFVVVSIYKQKNSFIKYSVHLTILRYSDFTIQLLL